MFPLLTGDEIRCKLYDFHRLIFYLTFPFNLRAKSLAPHVCRAVFRGELPSLPLYYIAKLNYGFQSSSS